MKLKPSKTTVTESVVMEGVADRIDEKNCVVRHVKILGLESRNGRGYGKAIRQPGLASLYEGQPVGVGHIKEPGQTRSGNYGDHNGLIRNVTVEADGLYGDHHYNPHHESTPKYLWDLRNNSRNVGFSQHADITTSRGPGGKQIVESIDRVISVDIVNRPATTGGAFESEGEAAMPKVMKLKEILEAVEEASDRKSLQVLEDLMEGGAMAADMPVEVSDGGADAQIKAAFRSAVVAAFDDESLDSKATLAKIKDVLNAYDKLTGSAKKSEAADDKGETKESLESLRAELNVMKRRDEVRAMAAKEGVAIPDALLAAAVVLESADARAAFVKALPKADPKKNVAKPASRGVMESEGSGELPAKPFESPKDVLSFIRSN